MSFMRHGSKLRWFEGESTEYIYGTIDKDGNPCLYDWKSTFVDPVQWIELIARMMYRETHDMEFVTYVVRKLAKEYNVEEQLKECPEWVVGFNESV